MTLRVRLEIVPFSIEEDTREIGRIDISNLRDVRNEGFGHVVCEYLWSLFDCDGELVTDGKIPEHDRRDGALELIRKVLETGVSL